MQYLIVLAAVFCILLLLPFLNAMICCRKEGSVLYINQSYVREARYFGKSFAKMVENSLTSVAEGNIFLSKKEKIINADKENIPPKADNMVLCLEKDFKTSSDAIMFAKEIYGGKNVEVTEGGITVRAVYAKQKLILGNKTSVVRWADAEETAAVYDDCSLGISTSAGRKLSIGINCTFQRLYAPEILIGQYPDQYHEVIKEYEAYVFEIPSQMKVKCNIRYVDKKMLDGKKIAEFSICSKYDVVILEGIVLKGDLRSYQSVRLCDKAVVCGNIFAEGNIHIGRNAVVLGNIFSQGSIIFEENVTVGRQGKIKSIVARENIIFTDCACVFGYISCEGGGLVKTAKYHREKHEIQFLDYEEEKSELRFPDLETYEKIGKQEYRKTLNLQKAVIPEKAKEVPRSMFFGCVSLAEVQLPETIEKIQDYAFADCSVLRNITNFGKMKIKEIGTSAFENCIGLEELEFSKELECLGGAAFAGCSNLRCVNFAEESKLKVISDHCFRDCSRLEWMEVPVSVERIGVSAFTGCDSLQYLCVPLSCAEEPGILELKDRPGLHLQIRDW